MAVWASAVACATVVVVAGLLPGFTVSFETYIITGYTERFLAPVERTHSLLGYGHPRYLAAVAAALLVIAAAAWGRRRMAAWPALAAILVAAVVALSVTTAVLGESNGRSGGVFLSDAVDEVRALVQSSRAARDPKFKIAGYEASPEIGWWITQGALWVLLAISSVALGRRRVGSVGWLALGYVAMAALLVGLVPGPECTGEYA